MIKSEKKESSNTFKKSQCFSTKGYFHNCQPYSQQYLAAKQKVYSKMRSQQAQNQQNKENSTRIDKNPLIGYYILKGYNNKLSSHHGGVTQISQGRNRTTDKIINNMVKKYHNRKKRAEIKNSNFLPSIDKNIDRNSLAKMPDHEAGLCERRDLNQIKKRVKTEYEEY